MAAPPGYVDNRNVFQKSTDAWDQESRAAEQRALDAKLPEGWQHCVAADGRDYFVDHNNKLSHWTRPPELPEGWTMAWDPQHQRYYFIDNVNKTTTFTPPVLVKSDMEELANSMSVMASTIGNVTSRAVNSESGKATKSWMSSMASSMMTATKNATKAAVASANESLNGPSNAPPPNALPPPYTATVAQPQPAYNPNAYIPPPNSPPPAYTPTAQPGEAIQQPGAMPPPAYTP